MDESDGVLFHHLLDLAELPRAEEEDAKALGSQLTSQDSGSWSEFMDSSFTEYLDNMGVKVREACPLDAMRAMWVKKKYVDQLRKFVRNKMKLEVLRISVSSCGFIASDVTSKEFRVVVY